MFGKNRIINNMENKLQKAISNNKGLYEAIFSNHNIKTDKTDSIWYSLEKVPPLYSNLVTLSKDWKPDNIFQTIDSNYEKGNWKEWSVKDSFQVLDLIQYGFEKLFDAQWMYLDRKNFIPIENDKKLHYVIVKNEEILSAWRIVWDSDEGLGAEIFNSKLLDNPDVYFVAGYEGEKIVSGCLINKTDEVFGISNFFAPSKEVIYWSGMISFIYETLGQIDIVGYERKELVSDLSSLGFEAIGNLAVWLKKRNL